jgi:hypothetical protein
MSYKENRHKDNYSAVNIAEVQTNKLALEELLKIYIQKALDVSHSWSLDKSSQHALMHTLLALGVYLFTKDGGFASAAMISSTALDLFMQIPKKIQQVRYVRQTDDLSTTLKDVNLGLERLREHDFQTVEMALQEIATLVNTAAPTLESQPKK